jgi:hypothetical protein
MKMLSAVVAFIALLAVSSLSFAQEKTVDPQIIEQLNALTKKYIDAAALAALFTEDAVMVTDTAGPFYGQGGHPEVLDRSV